MVGAVSLADEADGRVISLGFSVKLTPPQDGRLGDTDAASEIGRRLILEAVTALKSTGEAGGFAVEAKAWQVVY